MDSRLRRLRLDQLVVPLLVVFAPASGAAQSDGDADAFVAWARQAAVPIQMTRTHVPIATLEALAGMLGDSRIVALSEGVHGGAEPLVMRNELIEYLVSEHGFSAIAIESGLPESWAVNDFVRGAPGDLDQVVERGFSWGFHRYPQNRDLVAWLRDYNMTQPAARQVDFYGFDVSGSPGVPVASPRPGLEVAMDYLADVDSAAARAFEARLPIPADSILNPLRDGGFALSTAQRDRVTVLVSDLISQLRRNEARYSMLASEREYRWAVQTTVAVGQAHDWLRQFPQGWSMDALEAGDVRPLAEASAVRDRGQADNLRWILEQEGPQGRVLVFASNYHTSASPMAGEFSIWDEGDPVAGTYLKRWFGDDYFGIANTVRTGSFGCGRSVSIPDPTGTSLSSLLGTIGHPYLLLDLRSAPGAAAQWLGQVQNLAWTGLRTRLGQAYDIVLHLNEVSPAC